MVKKVILIFSFIMLMVFSIVIQPITPVHAEESQSQCWAVIIGISGYQHISIAHYADNNAERLYHELIPVWGEEHIKLLIDDEATKTSIEEAIGWLATSAGANDTVLFYYSGHGTDDGYIIPNDGAYDDEETWISSVELGEWFQQLDNGRTVIVLDTCYAGMFEEDLSADERVVIMAASSDETVWTSSRLKHSAFTYFLLEAFSEFDAVDADNNYEFSAEELFHYADTETISLTTNWSTSFPEVNIHHPVVADDCPGELCLIYKIIVSTEPDLPSKAVLFSLDDTDYTAVPPPLI